MGFMKALIEPYYGGSHKSFADSVIKKFPDEFMLFTLPPRHWKWRMHGAAVTFAEQVVASGIEFSEIFVTSLIDLALLKSLLCSKLPKCRYTIYFHENQLAYPWSQNDNDPTERKDLHYGFINFTSALVADRVIFNSNYNKNSFFDALGPFLKAFPDENVEIRIPEILSRSEVIYPGIEPVPEFERIENEVPVILWNHRWEYDKNPDEFFHALFKLKEKGIKFKLAVAGEEKVRFPEIFGVAKEKLKNEIISFGYLENRERYIELLKKCDILPVTSNHEFFGISVLEAASAGVIPLLPKRLSYPELFPLKNFRHLFYENGQLAEYIEKTINNLNSFNRLEIRKRASCFNNNNFASNLI
jgi:glycosyltransferase involved in cell wall biosynthesis